MATHGDNNTGLNTPDVLQSGQATGFKPDMNGALLEAQTAMRAGALRAWASPAVPGATDLVGRGDGNAAQTSMLASTRFSLVDEALSKHKTESGSGESNENTSVHNTNYDVTRDAQGRPVAVRDKDGKVVRSIEYNDDGSIKKITSEDEIHGKFTVTPTADGSEWKYEDGEMVVTMPDKVTVDSNGNLVLDDGNPTPRVMEPDGALSEVLDSRQDWAKRMEGGHTETDPETHTVSVVDKDGKVIRRIEQDDKGPSRVEDADGTSYVRNADGSWNRTGPTGYTTKAYNLKVDENGNINYEQNLFGMSEEAKQRNPLFRNAPRFRVDEYTDGRRREGLA